MLSNETLEQVSKLLKIEKGVLSEALKNEKEVTLDLPELQVFTQQEITTRDQNNKRLGYNDGKDAGLEIFIKDQKTKLGLDFDGKDPDKLISALQTKALADAKIEPNQKLQEKDGIIAKLQNTVKDYEDKHKATEQRLKEVTLRGKVVGAIPGGLPLEPDEVLMSMQAKGYSFEEDESGAIIPKKNGEVIRDTKTQNPLAHKDVINNYIQNERKWVNADDSDRKGRGGNSDRRTSGVLMKMSEAKTQWEAQGKSTNTAEFQAFITSTIKDNKDFDLDN